MNHNKTLRALTAILAITASAFALNASAQSNSPTGPGNTNTNKAGEAYPNDANAANPNKPKMGVVQKAENSTPVRATKRVAKKSKNAVKRVGHKAANAMRNTGDKIGNKLPPEPAPAGGVKQ
jgi:hypothetical protein